MRSNGRFIKIFLAVMVILQCLWISNALAIEDNYKTWIPQQEGVAIDRSWNIKFNYSLDESTLPNNIKIVQADTNESIKTDVVYNKSNNFITIRPLSNYDYGRKYILVIEDGVKSSKGSKLKQGIKLNFSAKAEEISNTSLLKEVFADPGTKINSHEGYYNAIRYALANFKSEITLNITNYNSKDYDLEVANQVLNDNPILNYGYNGARASVSSYGSTGSATMVISFKYDFNKERMEYMKKASQDKAKEIISKVIKPGMSNLEKELALHDYVVNNANYDTRLYSGNMPNESYLDYGVLVQGIGVCDSYARAMYRLLNMVGIECIYVTGDGVSGGDIIPHAWNIVKVDGKYYQLDATWNDPILTGGGNELDYSYLNVTDTQISKDHIWDKSKYPKSSDERFNYLSDMSYPVTFDKYIYYSSNFYDDNLYRINLDGTDKKRLVSDRALYIVVYGEWIYFSNYSDGGYIYRVKLDGTNETRLNSVHSINLRIENGVLYYTDYRSGIDKMINIQ